MTELSTTIFHLDLTEHSTTILHLDLTEHSITILHLDLSNMLYAMSIGFLAHTLKVEA
jgi:hypothetical protein